MTVSHFSQGLIILPDRLHNSGMTESLETFFDRLMSAMREKRKETGNDAFKPTQLAAGKLIGAKDNTTAGKWKRGGLPSMSNACVIAEKLGVSVEWLLTGRGSRYPESGIRSEQEARVLALWRTWTPIIKYEAFAELEKVDRNHVWLEKRYEEDGRRVSEAELGTYIIDTISPEGKFKKPLN